MSSFDSSFTWFDIDCKCKRHQSLHSSYHSWITNIANVRINKQRHNQTHWHPTWESSQLRCLRPETKLQVAMSTKYDRLFSCELPGTIISAHDAYLDASREFRLAMTGCDAEVLLATARRRFLVLTRYHNAMKSWNQERSISPTSQTPRSPAAIRQDPPHPIPPLRTVLPPAAQSGLPLRSGTLLSPGSAK
jgi:hypothetical protein